MTTPSTPRRTPYRFTEPGKCRWCGTQVKRPRRNWCGDECVRDYQAVQPQGLRAAVHQRDKGVCALCARDCEALEARIRERLAGAFAWRDPGARVRAVRWARLLARLGVPVVAFQLRRSLWDADHQVPLAEGGANELANVRTACLPCHKGATAALRRRLIRARLPVEDPRLPLEASP